MGGGRLREFLKLRVPTSGHGILGMAMSCPRSGRDPLGVCRHWVYQGHFLLSTRRIFDANYPIGPAKRHQNDIGPDFLRYVDLSIDLVGLTLRSKLHLGFGRWEWAFGPGYGWALFFFFFHCSLELTLGCEEESCTLRTSSPAS